MGPPPNPRPHTSPMVERAAERSRRACLPTLLRMERLAKERSAVMWVMEILGGEEWCGGGNCREVALGICGVAQGWHWGSVGCGDGKGVALGALGWPWGQRGGTGGSVGWLRGGIGGRWGGTVVALGDGGVRGVAQRWQ